MSSPGPTDHHAAQGDPARRLLASLSAAGVTRVPRPGARRAAAASASPSGRSSSGDSAGDVGDPESVLATVDAEVRGCTLCKLAETRTCAVPGEGDPRARVVFVGEGPGAEEDKTGRPFVGRAGKLLDDIITKGMQLRRQDVFICNVVKCRPPGNRVPEPDEVAACTDYLARQLAAIAPKVIVALGATAVRRLLDDDTPMGKLRGGTYEAYGFPVIPTYHPAYLLRNPAAKKAVWEDIQRVMKLAADG